MPHHEMPINKRQIALTAGFMGYVFYKKPMSIIFEFILQALIEVLFFTIWIIVSFGIYLTGDIVLWIITLGKHDPTWSRYQKRSNIGLQIFTDLVFWLGVGTWIMIAIAFHQFG